MKKFKKIGVSLILVVVIAVGIVVGVMASSEYTGDIKRFESLVQKVIDATTLELKETALDAAEKYIVDKPIDPEERGYEDLMELYLQAKLDTVDLYIAQIENEETDLSLAQESAVLKDKWFVSAFPTEESKVGDLYTEMLAKVHAANLSVFNDLYDEVDQDAMVKADTDKNTANADGRYKIVKTFFSDAVFDTEASDYAEAEAKMDELVALYSDAKEARYQALIAEARMSDYGVRPVYSNNFEGTTSVPSVSNYNGYNDAGLSLKNTYGKVTQVYDDGTTNTYFNIDINGAKNSARTSYLSTYFTLSFGGTVDCFVMEMDLTSFTTLPNRGILFQSRPSAGTNTWMQIDGSGNILDHNNNIIAEKAIVPGEWTHISIICDMENINKSRLYLDYAFAGYINGDSKKLDYTPENMRIGNLANSSGQICVDNIYVSFTGSICDQDYLNDMQDIEEFIYLCNYMQRTGSGEKFIKVPDCVEAYERASDMISIFASVGPDGTINYRDIVESIENETLKAQLKQAVEDYYSYDPSEVIIRYMKENLVKYKDLIDELKAIAKAPTSTSINARQSQINKIQQFVNANGEYIFEPGDDYEEITAGSGTASDPYLVPHGNHLLVYTDEMGGGFVYYKYVAKDDGTLKLSVLGDGVVLKAGGSVDDLAEVDLNTSISVAEGDEIWFALKCDLEETTEVEVNVGVAFDLQLTYEELLNDYANEMNRIEQDRAISTFISSMTSFENATSAALMQTQYDRATALIADGLNTALSTEDGYSEFARHLNDTYVNAPAKIALAKKDVVSKEIISAIEYITSTYPEESDWKISYIENPVTEEDLANNERYDFIEKYVVLIRGKLAKGNYNPDYINAEGVSIDIAVQRFANMNDHYYGIFQDEHSAHLSDQLAIFESTDSYIEKKGVISYIQRYLNDGDVMFAAQITCQNEGCSSFGSFYEGMIDDVARPTCPVCGEDIPAANYKLVSDHEGLAAVLLKYMAYEAELVIQVDNYDALLNQNTIYFLNTVKKFDTAITYVDKLALLNEAMPFYYAMNISSEDVEIAIAKYDALAAELAVVQSDSKSFIENVLMLPIALEDGIDSYYEYLVVAAGYKDIVDESIEGVTEALAEYEAALQAYEAVTGTVNDEIKESANAIGAFGSNCGFTAIISVVLKKLFAFS